MKTIPTLAMVVAALSLSAAPTPPASTQSRTPLSVAIFDFESKEESVRDLGPKLAALINAHLSVDPNLMLVERAELEKAMGEQELGLSGTVSGETAAKVGHLTGAKVLVTGKIFRAERELMVVAKVIGTETSRVFGELAKGPASGSLDELATQISPKIAAIVSTKQDQLTARPEDRVAAIKKKLGAAKLPTVAVRIPETHYGSPAVDPAAETELGQLLQQCGFTVIDDKSKDKPEVEIQGEAFSAFGLRRGNLVSCRARIEVKARHLLQGRILAIDREVSVAVDITEQTAAKTALQSAAAELASRLLPRLVANGDVAANP